MTQEQNSDKMRNPVRILKLQPMEGAKIKNSSGMVDPRLFEGENRLIAKMDETSVWRMRYEKGITPEPLKQAYTSFAKLRDQAVRYFKTRNVEVVEVDDDQNRDKI